MRTTELKAPVAEAGIRNRTHLTCAVCPHEWDTHDPIGIRFCSATVAGGLHRGCACGGDTRKRPDSGVRHGSGATPVTERP